LPANPQAQAVPSQTTRIAAAAAVRVVVEVVDADSSRQLSAFS
jgi:hypothetical protein